MSWRVINEVLGLAMLDSAFAKQLLQNPVEALHAHNFQLSQEEQHVFSECRARTLQELSQCLLDRLGHHASD
jgi:hypothetical protein